VLRQSVADLKAELEQVREDLLIAGKYQQEAERLKSAIVSANERVKELEVRLEQVMDIYQTLKGDNPLKISFERYILIEFLEQILHAANVRLQNLSNGQFTLQRSDRLETHGKQSGLGLDVYDAYTGQNRDVKSLSGGEKFNASLCLALGMTDVIQAHQGGVSIEMMFIDEGFGALDEDALNKAIATLIDLQRTGRMIGVISHVQELKQAFPAVLEVQKTKEGYSRTTILVK
jgi:exonuclease SbcC